MESWEWTPRDGQAGPRSGPLDLTGSPGHCHCLWTCWGAGTRPEPGPDTEQQEAPAGTGAAQGDYDPLLLSPHQAAGSEHQGQSQATSHTVLPGLGLARCGPAQAREAKGPAASAAAGHDPWLVAASAALVGATAQTVQAGPCGSGRAKAS